MSRLFVLAFDFAGEIGVSIARSDHRSVSIDRAQACVLDLVVLPNAETEPGGNSGAVRARIHDPLVWNAVSAMFRSYLLQAFNLSSKTRGDRLVVAYEQVNFASSVYWAQMYGGLVATMMSAVDREFSTIDKPIILGVNVSRIKSVLTGDSGAPKQAMEHAMQEHLGRALPTARKSFQEIPRKKQHNTIDALGCALTAMQTVFEREEMRVAPECAE